MGYTYVRTCVRPCLKAPWDANETEMSLSPVHLLPERGCLQGLFVQESRPYGHLSNRLAWLKENTAAPGIMYLFLPVGYKKDCFLRETIASWSWNNWNMTHVEIEISLSLSFLKIALTDLGRVGKVFNWVVTVQYTVCFERWIQTRNDSLLAVRILFLLRRDLNDWRSHGQICRSFHILSQFKFPAWNAESSKCGLHNLMPKLRLEIHFCWLAYDSPY